jgi:hypothetical protein
MIFGKWQPLVVGLSKEFLNNNFFQVLFLFSVGTFSQPATGPDFLVIHPRWPESHYFLSSCLPGRRKLFF